MSYHFPAWMDHALCAETDPEIFFPAKGGSVREAKAVCARCPVREPCADTAITNDEHYGIWSGMTENDRRRLRRRKAS